MMTAAAEENIKPAKECGKCLRVVWMVGIGGRGVMEGLTVKKKLASEQT